MRNARYLRYCLVDVSPAHRKSAEEKMERANAAFQWSIHERIPQCDGPTLVIANELLDNLVFDITTTEVYQQFEPDKMKTRFFNYDPFGVAGRFGLFRTIDNLEMANVSRELGDYRIPSHIGLVDWMQELVEATANVTDLQVVLFDYMKTVTKMGDENWLRLYTGHERIVGVDNVLSALDHGIRGDITTDVTIEDLFVLFDTEGFSRLSIVSQSQWLTDKGIELLIDSQLSSSYDELKNFVEGNRAHLESTSFNHEREILTDMDGLGNFSVFTAHRQV
jgi:SAM-dependent MidA family methyltransferase